MIPGADQFGGQGMLNTGVIKQLCGFSLIVLASFLSAKTIVAQNAGDVVVLKNGDRLTGEIMGMQSGELKFLAPYMAETARLDWTQVERLESKSTFMVFLSDGKLFTNVLRVLPTNSSDVANFVIGPEHQALRVKQLAVLRIVPANKNFWKRLEGSVNFGFSFTSGNDQYQTDLIATTTYRTGLNAYTASIDSTFSGQTKGTSARHNQFAFDYKRQLTPQWYAGGLLAFLHSDQQQLSLRTSVGGLIGRSLKQTERTRFSVFGGIVGNREKYSASSNQPQTTNAEALAGMDFASFRFNRTDLRSRVDVFPSLTTPGRIRVQATSDLRIRLAKDFWWGFHVYESFDSKSPVRAEKNDLGISATLGWRF